MICSMVPLLFRTCMLVSIRLTSMTRLAMIPARSSAALEVGVEPARGCKSTLPRDDSAGLAQRPVEEELVVVGCRDHEE